MELTKLEEVVGQHRSFNAEMVASSKKPAMMVFLCSLLRWPDRALAQSSITGSNVIGNAFPAKLFGPIRPKGGDDLRRSFGPSAEDFIAEFVPTRPAENHKAIPK